MSKSSDIAIIGVACRFPGGVATPEAFWDLLSAGTDAVSEIPDDRFEKALFLHPDPTQAGRSYTFAAGTLGDVAGFDAGFFGISAREAAQMDPQQRLLLEMAAEALERAGQVPARLAGEPCAVYVGISATDYADMRQGDPEGTDAYFMLGSTLSIAANRLSYVFDLSGPSIAIDTACSSALVALHEAVQALRGGRVPIALVGAVNLLLSPYSFVGFSRASMLAPYGRCRAFDRLAKGYVRAEGGGVVVLKRLPDAERDGDPIAAVIRGIGVNSDGRTAGIALPSERAQAALLKSVYRASRIHPRRVSYFEAHGTGTAAGDPIEAASIAQAIAARRPRSQPLLLGSVKTNIGHLEPASGMAGLVKAIEILRHGAVPPSLHCEEANPRIGLASLNLSVVRELTPLPRYGGRAVVGVNSFGFGGTNAHVVLEEYPAVAALAEPSGTGDDLPLLLSARTEAALRERAGETARWLRRNDARWRDVACTAARRRSHHEWRLVVRAAGREPAIRALEDHAAGIAASAVVAAEESARETKVALVFNGNGSQWAGMGASLLLQDGAFHEAVARIDALARPRCGWSILEMLRADPDGVAMDDTRIAQPLLFAVQVGVAATLRARGLAFAGTVGHSVGEVAAAHVAGALTLDDAVRIILERSDAQGRTKGQGRMAAVELAPEAARLAIAPYAGRIELAAENSPGAVTLSGDLDALLAFEESVRFRKIGFRLLDLDYAFHGPTQDPAREDLIAALADLAPQPTHVPFYSTVHGRELAGPELTGLYWWENVRRPVRFNATIGAMAEAGFGLFIEIGPHPILQNYLRHSLAVAAPEARSLPTLSRGSDGAAALDRCVDRSHVLGATLALDRVFPEPGRVVALPTYPWQRERHWFPRTTERRGPNFARLDGPLLGARLVPDLPVWERQIDETLFPFLADHAIGGSIVFPATGFVEIALEAARAMLRDGPIAIEEMEIRRPLVLGGGESRIVRFTRRDDDGVFRIESRPRLREEAWSTHVIGRLTEAAGSRRSPPEATLPDGGDLVAASEHYRFTEKIGFRYGPRFQTVLGIAVAGETAIVEIVAPDAPALDTAGFRIHPALLDGALQGVFALLRHRAAEGSTYLPQRLGRVIVHRDGVPARAEVTLSRAGRRALVANAVVRDAAGEVIAELGELRFQSFDAARRTGALGAVYEIAVMPLPLLDDATPLPGWTPDLAAALPPAPAADDGRSLLDGVARGLCADALLALGDDPVAASRRPLLDRVLAIATVPDDDPRDGAARWRDAIRLRPDLVAELTLLGRGGRALPEILRGSADLPIGAGSAAVEHLFDSAPSLGAGNEAIVAAVGKLVVAWPGDRPMRVLALGAGAAGMSSRLLDLLPSGRSDLTIAGGHEDELARLRSRFGDKRAARVARLDLAASPEDRGDAGQERYDLIVGSYGLCGARSPLAALGAMVDLAAPDAVLLVCEPVPTTWIDLLFGLSGHEAEFGVEPRAIVPETLGRLADAVGLRRIAARTLVHCSVLAASCAGEPRRHVQRVDADDGGSWIIHGGASEAGFAAALRQELRARGAKALLAEELCREGEQLDAGSVEGWEELWSRLRDGGNSRLGLIHLAGCAAAAERSADLLALQEERCWPVIASLQGLRSWPETPKPALVVVSIGTHGRDRDGRLHTGLAGLARVIRNEAPDLACRVVDLDPEEHGLERMAGALAAEILGGGEEPEILLGADFRLAPRVRERPAPPPSGSSAGATALAMSRGGLEGLAWNRRDRQPPRPGEVEVEVQAAGLNFRDVMFALGAVTEDMLEGGFAGPTLGMEAAGIVTRIGDGVTGLPIGTPVLCFAPGSFASHVVTPRAAVARLPHGVAMHAAATVPTAFLTVAYALGSAARLAPGERVLIHGAAGGVGIAAIQYAQHIGAEVFATAGSDEKRAFVALLGVPEERIFDSRSLGFADEIMRATRGEGVDVVLNSIAGEAVHRGLSVLRPFGRFVELGKVDFALNTRIGLRPFRNNIAYFGVDADQLLAAKPEVAERLFREVVELFERGVLRPLPHRVFSRRRIVDAFRHMQQSRHIGKIVVDMAEPERGDRNEAHREAEIALDPAATYLVTGGLSGFGLATAAWLAERGARHLCLVSRRGTVADEEDAAALAAIRARGAAVETRPLDVTDEDAVAALVAGLAGSAAPLRGIVHAAAVFDDGLVAGMTKESLRCVLAPKIAGASALHRATERLKLDFFLLYSSISATIGTPGQGAYAVANGFLESLGAFRAARGLPATVVAWGPIADAGYLGRNAGIASALGEKLGADAMPVAAALGRLGEALQGKSHHAIVAELDWGKAARALPALRTRKFRNLVALGPEEAAERAELATVLATLDPARRRDAILDILAQLTAKVLRISHEKLDRKRSIFDLGMDSLMALELRMMITERLGIELPEMALAQDASVERLGDLIGDRMGGGDEPGTAAGGEVAELAQATLSRHAETLPSAELDRIVADVTSEPETQRARLIS